MKKFCANCTHFEPRPDPTPVIEMLLEHGRQLPWDAYLSDPKLHPKFRAAELEQDRHRGDCQLFPKWEQVWRTHHCSQHKRKHGGSAAE
jgi:hypothetical protein